MSFFRFIFSFLYIRNWHTGKMELSWQRVSLFLAFILLLTIAIGMIAYLQTPIVYSVK
ncbi:MAG: hypothetical protein R3B53_02355 [Candidatus Paceibacterota bacterium]